MNSDISSALSNKFLKSIVKMLSDLFLVSQLVSCFLISSRNLDSFLFIVELILKGDSNYKN
jgi:hypothetical protein